MARPQYNDPAYRREKERLRPIVEAGQAMCAELVCIKPTRHIPAGSKWMLAHDHRDPTGQALLGPSHYACGCAENARRNNPKRASAGKRWRL